MKNYILFAGPTYYPIGGWGDFINSFSDLGEAIFEAKKIMKEKECVEWAHIVDTKINSIVWEG